MEGKGGVLEEAGSVVKMGKRGRPQAEPGDMSTKHRGGSRTSHRTWAGQQGTQRAAASREMPGLCLGSLKSNTCFRLSCFNAVAAQSHGLPQTPAYPLSSEQAPKAFLWMVLTEKSDGANGADGKTY